MLAIGGGFWGEQIKLNDISFLTALPQLEFLDIQSNGVSNFSPLSQLKQLRGLILSSTSFSDLTIVKSLIKLKWLITYNINITEGADLNTLTQLQILYLWNANITKLKALDNLPQLQILDCFNTNITELKGIDNLNQLRRLNLNRTNISQLPEEFVSRLSLEELMCFNNPITNVPSSILSTKPFDNCLPRVKAYFASLKQGAVPMTDLKLMVLGNGQIGKTQICRRLCGESFDETVPSTHGVLVRQANFDFTDHEQVKLNLWDFGGQEIYHGTHSLFFNAHQCIFLTMWHPKREKQSTHIVDDMKFRDHPLSYWLTHIKQQNKGSNAIPVIVAQSLCDEPSDGEYNLPITNDLHQNFKFFKQITTSAKAEGGLDELKTAIRNAIRFIRKHHPQPPIPKPWHRVKQQIEAWIAEDSQKPEQERQHQLLSYQSFVDLYQGKNISELDPNLIIADYAVKGQAIDTLLHLLHHSGVVFYKKGLFNNQLLLDQSWALNAIYAVFHRKTAYHQIKQNGGKFYQGDLGHWLWNEAGYSEDDQVQFIKMMESCGVCFSYSEHYSKTTYVVPELLPDKTSRNWHCLEPAKSLEPNDTVTITYEVDMLHTALFNRVLAMVGKQAKSGAIYWQEGLLAFETKHNSWLLFERKMTNDFEGVFTFSARCGNAKGLIDDFERQITWRQHDWSVQLIKQPKPETTDNTASNLQFDQTPPHHKLPEVFISYSWREDSVKFVDNFCQQAIDNNIHIIRDTNALNTGDSITAFMRRIGAGKRIIVILSDAYLKSPNCMFELYEIWRNSKNEPKVFNERIKTYALEDTKIYDLDDRLDYAIFWKTKFENVKAKLDEHGPTILGKQGYEDFEHIQQFYLNVNSMLSEIADILAPQSLDDLINYGLDGLE